MAADWAASQARSEAEAFEMALNRKPSANSISSDIRIERIAANYTFEQQRSVFAEECAEAIQAVCKLRRTGNTEDYLAKLDALAGEVADVLIMAQQMRIYLGRDKVDNEIEFKLNRQLERIKEESR
jgi:NTP pyrophosphatase (non-canonical NTP hydrolase)